ncbi:MAG TPA: hypothetical protein VFR93_09470 [Candidatus Limnocylindrales bacterium]|nr:hypothetical protein [Candidatus Limnocylindrales bacterium]
MTDDATKEPARERLLEDPAESRARIRAERRDLETELGPLGEHTNPSDPPHENAPLGKSQGAGLQNQANDRSDPDRDRWREIRM